MEAEIEVPKRFTDKYRIMHLNTGDIFTSSYTVEKLYLFFFWAGCRTATYRTLDAAKDKARFLAGLDAQNKNQTITYYKL